jgi:hypothetical protein
MIQIKKTKSVEMYGDKKEVDVKIYGHDDMGVFYGTMTIPIGRVFQVKRGLESYVQRFYRKDVKKHE